MAESRFLLDNTFFSDIYLSNKPEDQARLPRIISGVSSHYEVAITSVVLNEATQAKENPAYPKDRLVDGAISDSLDNISIELTQTEKLAYEARRLGATHPSMEGFFPKGIGQI